MPVMGGFAWHDGRTVSSLSRTSLPVAVLATAVLVVGVAAAGSLGAAATPAVTAAPPPRVGPIAPPRPAAVSLPVTPAPKVGAAHDPGDPSTWPARQLAAQLVFSCVQSASLGTVAEHARMGLGGVVVMGRPTDRGGLTAGLARAQAAAPHGIAPLLAADEEGGRVQRLKGVLGPLPPAAEMGRWPDARIQSTARAYATGMRSVGIRLALSPVADLAAPGRFLTDQRRTFSADHRRVAGAAVAWSKGLQEGGVLSAVKHWPGHGYAADSHAAAPAAPPLATLATRDLLPFDAVMKSGASLVMVGHLRSAGLTEPGLPATLSPNALRVLRERAGPRTVLLTDSVSMAASSSAIGLTPAQAAVKSLQAGADWVMSCGNAPGAVNSVQAAIETGALPRPRAEAAARRILGVKQGLGLLKVPPTTAPPAGAVEKATLTANVVTLVGKATDADTPAPPRVHVTVDGAVVKEVVADPATSAFRASIAAFGGTTVCAVALNTGPGRSTPLGCVALPARRLPVA